MKMKKIIIIYYHLFFASMLFAGNVNFETGWEYTQPTLQSFYIIETISIDGEEAEGYIDNSSECIANAYSCDVAGAFIIRDETVNGQDLNGDEVITPDAEVCVGWTYVESAGWTTIPLFGDDGSDYISDHRFPRFKNCQKTEEFIATRAGDSGKYQCNNY